MLWPQEHGAYAQLAFPLASGFAVGDPSVSAVGFAIAAIALFLAAEPIEVLIGARGSRARETLAGPAHRQLVALGVMAGTAGLAAIATAPPPARILSLAPGTLGVVLGAMVFARRVKTLGGELVAVAAFASLHLPLAASGGARGVQVWGPPLAWFAVFAAATFAVHALKARHKGRTPGLVRAAMAVAATVVVAALSVGIAGGAAQVMGWAAIAPAAAALYVAARPIHPRHLKRVGWALVAANLIALALMLRA